MIQDALSRTFGIEIEMCNFDRKAVELPSGFSWSKDETIYNTDTTSGRNMGGEINTPPLHLCQYDRYLVHKVYKDLVDAGGRLKWSIGTHVHIYAGDLSLEQLKNLFLFVYHTYPYFKRHCQIPDWDEKVFICKPIISEQYYERVRNAESFNELQDALSNQSKKGYIRFAINVASYFVRKTVEFRCYNASQDPRLIENCILSTYRFFYYAINHTEEDFKSFTSYEDFVTRLRLPKDMPPIITPLIYQGNPYSPIECFLAPRIPFSSRLAKALLDQKPKEVCMVNPAFYSFELAMYNKCQISIYNQNNFSHLLYLIATNQLQLSFTNHLVWLEQFNKKDNVRQLALVLYAAKIRKFIDGSNQYKRVILESYMAKAEETITNYDKSAEKLIEMLNSVKYVYGGLRDAIENEKCIFYQYGKDKHSNSAFLAISKNTDLKWDLVPGNDDFYNLVESIPEGKTFYIFSDSPYLDNMHKLAYFKTGPLNKTAGRFLYCNKPSNEDKSISTQYLLSSNVEVKIPPTDLVIDDPKKLKIYTISSSELFCLQNQFIKKVDKVSAATWVFAVMYEDYCLGAFGFKMCPNENFGIWQLTDFCTNNDVPRLSKLILLCILHKQVQKVLSRALGSKIETALSFAYTKKPVSMKYRGIYNKEKELCTPNRLAYSVQLGQYKSTEEIINKYQNMLKK